MEIKIKIKIKNKKSDHGLIYVFDRKTGNILDVLRHADEGLVQTITMNLLADATLRLCPSYSADAYYQQCQHNCRRNIEPLQRDHHLPMGVLINKVSDFSS
jgi:hypothetical protein